MSTIEAGLRGGGIAVLLLLALLGARDRHRSAAAPYAVLFMLCGAAYLVESAPGLVAGNTPWVLPLRLMSCVSPALFQLYAAATFDDAFRPSWVAWLPTAAMTALSAWAMAADRMLPWRVVNIAGLVLVGAGLWQVLGGRAGDLVEGRRRFRLVLVIAAGLTVAGFTILAGFTSAQTRAYGSGITAAIVLTLAMVSAVLRLGWRPVAELAPAPAAARIQRGPTEAVAIEPEERGLLDRLQRLMGEERVYREEGLTVAALAARLAVPEYRLRRLINQRLGHRNFSSFVNGYRLAETTAALADPAQAQVPILTIALDAGFQSIGPFNRAFKALTGMTPTDFRRERLERAALADC